MVVIKSKILICRNRLIINVKGNQSTGSEDAKKKLDEMEKHFQRVYGIKKTNLLLEMHSTELQENSRFLTSDAYVALLQKFDICVNETGSKK